MVAMEPEVGGEEGVAEGLVAMIANSMRFVQEGSQKATLHR
jgi:hypothetical protein